MSGKKEPTRRGGLTVRLKKDKKRSKSSRKWLERQLNDPYVEKAKREGFRSRAAYKLIEINDKFNFLKRGAKIVDLGAAPGSWMQVAVKKGCVVIGIDLNEIDNIPETEFIHGDFLDQNTVSLLCEKLNGKADVVMSDMAAPSCGHHQTDHIRIMALCEEALEFALQNLKEGGVFLAKVLRGGAEETLLLKMKNYFNKVKHIKPKASRQDSSEMYVMATGFKNHS